MLQPKKSAEETQVAILWRSLSQLLIHVVIIHVTRTILQEVPRSAGDINIGYYLLVVGSPCKRLFKWEDYVKQSYYTIGRTAIIIAYTSRWCSAADIY